jgi:hypothetical protein
VVAATWCPSPRNTEAFPPACEQSLHQVLVPVPYHESVLLAVESAVVKRHKRLQESAVARMFCAWLGRPLSRCSLKRLIFLSTQLDCSCVCMYVFTSNSCMFQRTCGRLQAVSSLQDSSSILCQNTFVFLETNFPIFTQIHTNFPIFTQIHTNFPIFTQIHTNFPIFTLIHTNFPIFTHTQISRSLHKYTQIRMFFEICSL